MVQSYLSGIFGASPIRPLTEHMNKVVDCADHLLPFVDAALADADREAMKTEAHQIKGTAGAMGYPLMGVALVVVVWAVRRSGRRVAAHPADV